MSDGASIASAPSRQPVDKVTSTSASPSADPNSQEGSTRSNGSSQSHPQGLKSAPAPFKDPALSLSPHLANIKVGDILQGQVDRIDPQSRAIVQNTQQTLLVDPAAELKAGARTELKVTQIQPEFLGKLIGSPKDTERTVKLALVALRGIGPPPQQILTTASSSAQTLNISRNSQATLNQPGDVARLFSQTTSYSAASPLRSDAVLDTSARMPSETAQAISARPANFNDAPLIIPARVGLDNDVSAAAPAFLKRHPFLSAAPKTVSFAIMPSGPVTLTHAAKPHLNTPIGQLVKMGRAIVATLDSSADAPQSAGMMRLSAKGMTLSIPHSPALTMKDGERLVLLSLEAKPYERALPAENDEHAALLKTVGSKLASLVMPQSVATALPSPFLLPMATKATQFLQVVLGITPEAIPEETTSPRLSNHSVPTRETLTQPSERAAKLLKLLPKASQSQLLAHLKDLGTPIIASFAGQSGETPSIPVIVPTNSETSLIASLIHLNGSEDSVADNSKDQAGEETESEGENFKVEVAFDRFGETTLEGRISKTALTLTLFAQHALPEGLQRDLLKAFSDQCAACGLDGALYFSARSDRA